MRSSNIGVDEGEGIKKAGHGENAAHDALVVAKDEKDAAANEGDEVIQLSAAAEEVLRQERHDEYNDLYDTLKRRENEEMSQIAVRRFRLVALK
jgi:hypothetical protein